MNTLSPNKRACLAAAALFPIAAHGSFGGTPCGADFTCHFVSWGLLLGSVGIPVSGSIFAVLHMWFCHEARSQRRQFFLGAFIGVVAYELSAVCAALIGAFGKVTPGQPPDYLLMGFVSPYILLAVASVLYARSTPRPHAG